MQKRAAQSGGFSFRMVVRLGVVIATGVIPLASVVAADIKEQIQVSNTSRTYSIHVPDGPAPAGGFPLVLVFHGGGMQGEGMRRLTNMDAVADQRRFITVYPDGIDKHWNDGRATIKNPQDDVRFVSSLITRMEERYTIARGRIYATGISNGALFVERLGCELSDRIAAIAPVAGTMPANASFDCKPAKPVAVIQIDGTADPIMPFDGGSVADFGGRGEGGQVQSVAETVHFWAKHNGCKTPGVQHRLPPSALIDRTRVIRTDFSDCLRGGSVQLLTVTQGGHAWPGGGQYAPRLVIGIASRQINASEEIANFFLSLPSTD